MVENPDPLQENAYNSWETEPHPPIMLGKIPWKQALTVCQ